MLLANRKGEWCLAAFASHLQGCNLSVNHPPQADRECFHLWTGTVYVWSNAPLEAIVFFPTLRLLGCEVWPWNGWKNDTEEPILNCMMGNWWASPDEPMDHRLARKRRLVDEFGWVDHGRDGLFGFVHVDDLEKIEGPPPEGAF